MNASIASLSGASIQAMGFANGTHVLEHHYIVGLLQGAVRRGHDPRAILAKAGISAERYDDARATINGREAQCLIQVIRQELGDNYLGFLDETGKLGMDLEVGKVAMQHDTLGAAIKGMCDFVEAIRNDQERHLSIDERSGEYTYGMRSFLAGGQAQNAYYFHYYRLAWTYRYLCWLTGRRINLTRVCFTTVKPPGCSDYDEVFDCPVEYSSDWNSLNFQKSHLNAPIVRTMAEFNHADFPDNYPDWFNAPGRSISISRQVEHVLMELHKEEIFFPPIQAVAKILSVSPRTLRRLLASENEGYQKIKDQVRRDLAQNLLATTNLPITTIAGRIGFTEPGVFTRAFLAWTRATPSAYRKLHSVYY